MSQYTPVFYRSACDGWRLGVAADFTSTTRITVEDIASGLPETVAPSAIYVPKDSTLLDVPPSFYTTDDDIATLRSPVESLPTLIAALRARFEAGKDGTLLGDATFIQHAQAGNTTVTAEFAKRIAAAAKAAVNATETLHVAGDGALDAAATIATMVAAEFPGIPTAKLAAAMEVLRPFCVTATGAATASVTVSLFPAAKAAHVAVSMLDTEALRSPPADANLAIFSYVLHGCSREEKERCHLPATLVDLRLQPARLDVHDVDACRVRFLKFRKAQDALGLDLGVQAAVLSRISAVMQLMQVEFTADGSTAQLAAIKNAARALNVDFNALSRMLTSAEACFALAAHLLRATVQALLWRINAVLGPKGQLGQAAVAVTVMPAPQEGRGGARGVVVECAQEDLLQCFLRTSEAEILQWQRCGFAVSEELQHAFDGVDNFRLLKVLRAPRGVLEALATADESSRDTMLEAIRKHKQCSYDKRSGVLSVTFSNESVVSVPLRECATLSPSSLNAPVFADLKQLLNAEAEADTLEALALLEQAEQGGPLGSLQRDLRDAAAMAKALVEPTATHWWCFGIGTFGGSFDGLAAEEALRRCRIRPHTILRYALPRRFVTCRPQFVVKEFEAILDKKSRGSGTDSQRADAILAATSQPFLVGKDGLLIEARTLMALYARRAAAEHRRASVIQAFARSAHVTCKMARRLSTWQSAIDETMQRIAREDERYRHSLTHADAYHHDLLTLQAEEQTARLAIREGCWVEWVALETDLRVSVESLLEQDVARRIVSEERHFKKVVRQRQETALNDLAVRVQERILLQGAHLDGIVQHKHEQLNASRQKLGTLRRVHDRRMNLMNSAEERRIETRMNIIAKNNVTARVAADRADKTRQLREEMWARHERDRLTRMEMARARGDIEDNMREKFVMEGIESTVAKRLAAEVTERNRRVREAEVNAMRREREEREKEMREHERKATLMAVKHTQLNEKRLSEHDADERRARYRQWTVQEKERQSLLRLKREGEKQNKKLTSALLQAHSMLSNPQLFDRSGRVHTSRSASRYQDPGFTMTDGNTSHTRLLQTDSLDAVISFHSHRSPTPFQKGMRAASPLSESSL